MSLQSFPVYHLINKRLVTFFLAGLLVTFNVYAECVEGYCVNGRGIYTWANGKINEGYWLDGQFVETFAEREKKGKVRIAKEENYVQQSKKRKRYTLP